MKRRLWFLDAFIIGGFVAALFTGFLNPLYISIILTRLDAPLIAAGSVLASALPAAMGALLGRRRVFQRLFSLLPWVMLAELAATAAVAVSATVDVKLYYVSSMFVMGVFSSTVMYLLQKVKEKRYRANRAVFDRRCEMADALGYLAGSGMSVIGAVYLREPLAVAAMGVLQTLLVYGLFLIANRSAPPARKRRAAEKAQAWDGRIREVA